MLHNKINAEISDEELEKIMSALTTVKEHLPFLISLSGAEIRALPKMGDSRLGFVQKSFMIAAEHPDIMPRGIDIDEMRKILDLYTKMREIRMFATQVMELLDCTTILIGSQMFSLALIAYAMARQNGFALGLDSMVAELGKGFIPKSKRKPPTTT